MPKAKEIAVALAIKNAYFEENKLTTRQVAEFIHRIFRFQKPVTRGAMERTWAMLNHMNHNGDVAVEKTGGGNMSSWWLTESGKDYARWWYKKIKEEEI